MAARTASRRALARELGRALTHRGIYEQSREQLTPLRRDPPSFVPAAVVVSRLLAAPRRAEPMARHTVASYSIGPGAIAALAGEPDG